MNNEQKKHMKAGRATEQERESEKREHEGSTVFRQTVHRDGGAREVLTGGLTKCAQNSETWGRLRARNERRQEMSV